MIQILDPGRQYLPCDTNFRPLADLTQVSLPKDGTSWQVAT